MTPEQKETVEKWLKALRSGKYKQGLAQLRSTNDEYCCLGVLADQVPDQRWGDASTHYSSLSLLVGNASFRCMLPFGALQKWTGLNEELAGKLSAMNDFENADFNKIADFIEEQLELAQQERESHE